MHERSALRQTLEAVYLAHRQGLYTLALALTGEASRAEDAVHDAFARLFGNGRMPQGDVVSYVFAAVRNAAIDQVRRRGAGPVPLGEAIYADDRSTANGPETPLLEAELQAQLRQAMNELPAEQAQVILLKAHAGLTFEQIAEVLDAPMGTVTSRYRRGLERLREKLEAMGVRE